MHALQLPAAAREEAELICSNVQLEMALIDDLLDWTRVMKHKLQLREKIGKHEHTHANHKLKREVFHICILSAY